MQAGFGHHCHHRRLDSLQRASNGDHLLLAAHLDPLLLLIVRRLLLPMLPNIIFRNLPFLITYKIFLFIPTLERTSWLSFRSLLCDHLLNYILSATTETKV